MSKDGPFHCGSTQQELVPYTPEQIASFNYVSNGGIVAMFLSTIIAVCGMQDHKPEVVAGALFFAGLGAYFGVKATEKAATGFDVKTATPKPREETPIPT